MHSTIIRGQTIAAAAARFKAVADAKSPNQNFYCYGIELKNHATD
ncbi:MAG: hypothetical protein ACFBSE_20795 [Prochloraceae cyanobacterium]